MTTSTMPITTTATTCKDIVALMVIKHFFHQDPKEYFAMLAHHSVVAALAFASIHYGAMLYYSSFFGGAAELSSIFLSSMNLLRAMEDGWKADPENDIAPLRLPTLNGVLRASFAVMFLSVRIVWWNCVNVKLFPDLVIASGLVETDGSTEDDFPTDRLPNIILWCWIVASLGLTLLQCFWGVKVVKGIMSALRPHDGQATSSSSTQTCSNSALTADDRETQLADMSTRPLVRVV
eukprot:TRINITY_DN1073_c0_g3_i1.p1 TRINITY_DN1073_c0_g3~~TRINITY_DN1073_c0_g3_i1.p1  ORF type:complete len:242 (+),score=34.45 TRINITY_DN1073_c0_g3_i1:23-727(+)